MKRREFLRNGAALAACLSLGTNLPVFAAGAQSPVVTPTAAKLGWQVSVQHYTYRRFSLLEALDKVAAVGLRNIEIRTNLKLNSKQPGMKSDETMPPDARKELKAMLADRGISVPSVFTDFNGKPEQAERIFACWKDFGTEIIVAEPPADSFDTLERLCEEHGMRLALHNHQEGQSKYWRPELVLEACRNRSKRLGACCDDGQWVRSGLDPVECLHQLQGRIISFHLKDVARKGDSNSPNTVIGQGQADNARTLNELKRLGYTGPVVIDFENDTPALQEDMARNVAFVESQAKRLLSQQP
jgi:sugar phosphate isomerase/epimerase